jgi:hypothetical protein
MSDKRSRTVSTVQFAIDTLHSLLDAVGDPQLLGRCHPSLFLCQFVQLFQIVLDVRVSDQLLQVLF